MNMSFFALIVPTSIFGQLVGAVRPFRSIGARRSSTETQLQSPHCGSVVPILIQGVDRNCGAVSRGGSTSSICPHLCGAFLFL